MVTVSAVMPAKVRAPVRRTDRARRTAHERRSVASWRWSRHRRPPRRPDRRPGLSVGRVFGVPLHLNVSMAAARRAGHRRSTAEFARRQLDLPQVGGYLIGFGFVVCLLGSVLLHELGHALTARRYGIGVRGITLELLGGYTEMDRDAPTPRVDLLVVAGRPGGLRWCSAASRWPPPWPLPDRHRGPPARLPARAQQRHRRACSTSCPACRWTAAGRCAPRVWR